MSFFLTSKLFNHQDKQLSLLLKFTTILVAISSLSLAIRSEQHLANKPLTDDGYYSLTISRNIAMHKGITIDGSTKTNGFQPLFTFISVPAFILAGENNYLALRFIMVLHWLFYITTAYLLGIIGRDALSGKTSMFWFSVLIYLASIYIFLKHFNGLETGCLLFFYCLAWRYYQKVGLDNWKGLTIFGIILGLLVLARIDAVFFVITISFFLFFSSKQITFIDRMKKPATVAGISFLISSPWWFYNLFVFGSLMPTSGTAQQSLAISLIRIRDALCTFFQETIPFIYFSRFGGVGTNLLQIVLTFLLFAFLWKIYHQITDSSSHNRNSNSYLKRTIEFGSCLFVSTLFLILWYTFSSWATHHYGRYFSPIFLLSTLSLGCVFFHLYQIIPKVVLIITTFLPIPLFITLFLLHTGKVFLGNTAYTEQLQLAKEFIPDRDYVGAGQTGTLGYFRDRVINLDGKVNPEALQFQNRMRLYLQRRKIRWFCDKDFYVNRYLGENPQDKGWKLVERAGYFILYRYEEIFR